MHNYLIQYVYYYNTLHVSSNTVLIIRRSNCINTASDIVFSVSDSLVCGGNCSISFSTCTPDRFQFLFNLHTGLVPVPSQPAHRTGSSSFSTSTPDWFQFLLNLNTGLVPVLSQPQHRTGSISFSICTPDGHLLRTVYQMLY